MTSPTRLAAGSERPARPGRTVGGHTYARPVILRATYRPAGQVHAPTRVLDIDRPNYDGAWAVALAEKREDEKLLHVRQVEDPDAP
jgi:hypothetical protein